MRARHAASRCFEPEHGYQPAVDSRRLHSLFRGADRADVGEEQDAGIVARDEGLLVGLELTGHDVAEVECEATRIQHLLHHPHRHDRGVRA